MGSLLGCQGAVQGLRLLLQILLHLRQHALRWCTICS